MPPLLGLHHAGITVADLDRSIAFYRDLLGLVVSRVFERTEEDIGRVVGYPGAHLKIALLQMPNSPVQLELLQYVNPPGTPGDRETNNPAIGHICFVAEDIHSLYDRVVAAGLHTRSEGPVEIAQGPHRGVYALYFRDPDGYTVELHQHPPI
jgi:catechol 2,3-dioxygenase-like lactoylglutathione lyase family enzyme